MDECKVDTDCPGTLVCFDGVSWAPPNVTSFCSCMSSYGWYGANCTELGPTSIWIVTNMSAQTLLALALLVLGASDLVRILILVRHKFTLSAAVMTQIWITIALIFSVAFRVVYLASVLEPARAGEVLSVGEARKFPFLETPKRVLVVLMQAFSVVASSSVSVLWMELAGAVRAMRTTVLKGITEYRRAVLIYNVLFFVTMTGVAIAGAWEFAAIVTLPYLLILIATFTLGRMRLTKLLKQVIANSNSNSSLEPDSSSNAADGSGKKAKAGRGKRPEFKQGSMEYKTSRTILAIQRCSAQVILSVLFVILMGVGYFSFRSPLVHPAGWKQWAPVGGWAKATIFSDLLNAGQLGIMTSISLYTHRNAKKMCRLERSRNATSENSNPTSPRETKDSKGQTMLASRSAAGGEPFSSAPISFNSFTAPASAVLSFVDDDADESDDEMV